MQLNKTYTSRGILLRLISLLSDKKEKIEVKELITATSSLKSYNISLYDYSPSFEGEITSEDLLLDLQLLKNKNYIELLPSSFVKITREGKKMSSKILLEDEIEKSISEVLGNK